MPFDRLIRVVDAWAGEHRRQDVFAQIGSTDFVPQHIQWCAFIEPEEFRRRMLECRAVISHAGTGNILTALELGKPILVMPRLSALQETRNDHQVATAQRFEETQRVRAAYDVDSLREHLEALDDLPAPAQIGSSASQSLLDRIRQFILEAGQDS